MGHAIKAKCECGYYAEKLMIGAGMLDFTNKHLSPALCHEGEHVVSVNICKDVLSCPDGHGGELIPYARIPLPTERLAQSYVSDWCGYKIGRDGYLCPKCKRFTLIFSDPFIYFD